tara:strand:- start:1200 stop:1646 length:447 start_codon:yes stop_codon:yes gene_type:complete
MDNDESKTSWKDIPDEIRDQIFSYLPITTLVWLNKEYYFKHHSCVESMIKSSRYLQYVTNMIIRDASFSFQFVMRENIVRWFKLMINNKKHRYGNKTYSSFLAFIMELSIASGSEKCRRIIEEVATEVIGPKWHKRNRSTSYKKGWSN